MWYLIVSIPDLCTLTLFRSLPGHIHLYISYQKKKVSNGANGAVIFRNFFLQTGIKYDFLMARFNFISNLILCFYISKMYSPHDI